MTGMERLEQRIGQAGRLSELYEAERQGLLRAKYTDEPLAYSADREKQARFDVGLREGREILKAHGTAPAAV